MKSKNPSIPNRLARRILAAASGVALSALVGLAPAQAAPCPNDISACGCTITKAEIYKLTRDLFATSSGNCIDIAKDHAILNLVGHRIIGRNDGTGIGIHILAGADHVIVEGGNEKDNDPPQSPAAGTSNDSEGNHQGVVAQWNIGIQDDADDAIIELFNVIGKEPLLPKPYQGNATAGVVLNHVNNSIVGDLRASGNGKYGVVLDGSSNIQVDNITTQGNGEEGIWLAEASNNNRVGPATTPRNGKLGAWIYKSDNNVIYDVASAANSDTGIVLGCAPDRKNCPGNERSNNNLIITCEATGNTNSGVVIGKHSGQNAVTINHNDNGGKKKDMIDDNNNCDSNVWYNNTGSANQDCIR